MTARTWQAGCAHGCDWLGPVRDDRDDAISDGTDHALAVVLHERDEENR